MAYQLSIVIPTFNELKTEIFPRILNSFKSLNGIEVIVADSHSTDGTLELAMSSNCRVIVSNENTRSARLNQGIRAATGNMILLHHPRSILNSDGLNYLIQNSEQKIWGGFTHSFDWDHPLLNFTSWYSNQVRFEKKGIVYLDHCIFAHRSFLQDQAPVPEVDIFEDTLLSQKLLKHSFPVRLNFDSVTSAVRFRNNGVYRQALLNQALKAGFNLQLPNKFMNRIYEYGLSLNSKY